MAHYVRKLSGTVPRHDACAHARGLQGEVEGKVEAGQGEVEVM